MLTLAGVTASMECGLGENTRVRRHVSLSSKRTVEFHPNKCISMEWDWPQQSVGREYLLKGFWYIFFGIQQSVRSFERSCSWLTNRDIFSAVTEFATEVVIRALVEEQVTEVAIAIETIL